MDFILQERAAQIVYFAKKPIRYAKMMRNGTLAQVKQDHARGPARATRCAMPFLCTKIRGAGFATPRTSTPLVGVEFGTLKDGECIYSLVQSCERRERREALVAILAARLDAVARVPHLNVLLLP